MDRYWNDPDATAAALTTDRWLRTGDLAVRRDDGCYVLSGRRTDMYVIAGATTCSPKRWRGRCRTTRRWRRWPSRPTRRGHGRIGVAVVVARTRRPHPRCGTSATTAARLARHKAAGDIVVVPRLPLTTVAKLDRAAWPASSPIGAHVTDDVFPDRNMEHLDKLAWVIRDQGWVARIRSRPTPDHRRGRVHVHDRLLRRLRPSRVVIFGLQAGRPGAPDRGPAPGRR